MPSINISENDFTVIAIAAGDAQDNGDMEQAEKLDKIARKINAVLSGQTVTNLSPFGRVTKNLSWRDMPSTLR